MQISIEVLKVKSQTDSKAESREKAGRILKRIETQEFMMLNLGLIDIYQELGETSKALRKVEQFLWTILEIQRSLVQSLEKRSVIKFTEENGECTIDRIDINSPGFGYKPTTESNG